MRARSQAEGELAVFDPEVAQKINAIDFGDLTLPDKLADALRGRKGEQVNWKQVRSAMIAQLRRLSYAEGIGQPRRPAASSRRSCAPGARRCS